MKRAFSTEQLKLHDRREDELYRLNCRKADTAIQMELLISRQMWRDNGQWPRYYKAREGRVHGSRYCPSLGSATLTALWQHSGDAVDEVIAFGLCLCSKCFPGIRGGGRRLVVACEGSGERSRCRCGDPQCRQMCPHCGSSVLITSSGVLRRHNTGGKTK
jgi:hypothetical protein